MKQANRNLGKCQGEYPEGWANCNSNDTVRCKGGSARRRGRALPVYPYARLRASSTNHATDIDQARCEAYLSSTEFREKFGMTKEAFVKLPKWKQIKLKISLQLF